LKSVNIQYFESIEAVMAFSTSEGLYLNHLVPVQECWMQIVVAHESIHHTGGRLGDNLNWSTPEKAGLKEAGTWLEKTLLGEEVDVAGAAIANHLSEWFPVLRSC